MVRSPFKWSKNETWPVGQGLASSSELKQHVTSFPGGGGALECNLTGRCPFFKSLDNPFRKKNCILTPCFGIFRLQNNRENNSLLFLKTIVFFSWTNSHNPVSEFLINFHTRSGIYAEKWYPKKRHVPYRFIRKSPPPGVVHCASWTLN